MPSASHLDEITDITNFPDSPWPFSASVSISININVFEDCSKKKMCTSDNANAASVLKDLMRIYLNEYNNAKCILSAVSYFILTTHTLDAFMI